MTAAELYKEASRQRKELTRLYENAPHELIKVLLEKETLNVERIFENGLSLYQNAPDTEIPAALEAAVVGAARALELLKAQCVAIPSKDVSFGQGGVIIGVHIELLGLDLGSSGYLIAQIVQERIQRPILAAGLLIGQSQPNGGMAIENAFYCFFRAKDTAAALLLVQQELHDMRLLPFSHIAYREKDSDPFSTFYLIGTKRPFDECARRYEEKMRSLFSMGGSAEPPSLPPDRGSR